MPFTAFDVPLPGEDPELDDVCYLLERFPRGLAELGRQLRKHHLDKEYFRARRTFNQRRIDRATGLGAGADALPEATVNMLIMLEKWCRLTRFESEDRLPPSPEIDE